jgi:Maltokinase N-terminal cap domain
MGLVYATATLEPSKQELLEAWLPSRPWASGATSVDKLAEYRFDDPAGEVGVETILWRTPDGRLLQVPFTYRSAPLDGAEQYLVGTTAHSVLGPRWVYDCCADPVWAATTAAAIISGGTQAQMVVERDGETIAVPARCPVRGSRLEGASAPAIRAVDAVSDDGPVTTVVAGPVTLSLARVVGTPLPGVATLTGSAGDRDLGALVALAMG